MDMRVKGEFYVAPVYNMLIDDGKKIVFKNIGSVGNGMYGLGVPEDLNAFLEHPISEKFWIEFDKIIGGSIILRAE